MLPFSSGIIQIAVLNRQKDKFLAEFLHFSKPKELNLENDDDTLKNRFENPFSPPQILQKDCLANTSMAFYGVLILQNIDLQVPDQPGPRCPLQIECMRKGSGVPSPSAGILCLQWSFWLVMWPKYTLV